MSLPPNDSHPIPNFESLRHRLVSAMRSLTEPSTTLSVVDRRRAHLLAWLLLVMILLTLTGLVLVFLVNPPGSPRRGEYLSLILLLLALFGLAYALNRKGHHQLSAVLTILCAVFGPWGSLVLDPSVRQGDFVPLAYVIISILLSSILLHPLFTILLAALQLTALMWVASMSSAALINWPSLLALISFTSVLSILANLIGQRDLEQIDRQTHQLAQSEAQQAALALSKTQLLEEAEGRIKQLSALHEVSTLATQVDTIDRLIECTTDVIGKNLSPDNFGILLIDEEKNILRLHPSYRFTSDQAPFPGDITLGQGITGQVARTGQIIRVGNVEGIRNYHHIDSGTASELCVPVKLKEKVLGVINVESSRREAFSANDELLLGTLAGQLATALEQLRATAAERRWLGQLAHSNELIRALSHIASQMQKAVSQDEIIRALGNELGQIEVTCAMAVRDQGRRSFTIKYTSMSTEALERLERRIMSSFVGYTLSLDLLLSILKDEELAKPSVIRNTEDQLQLFFPAWDGIDSPENKAGRLVDSETTFFRLPLVFEETLLGILWIWSKAFTEADLSVMSTFAQHVASALKRAQLFQEIQNLALTDPLTGLQNRRSLFDLGKIEFARAQHMDREFSCLMLDLDHFKKVNDTYGHPIGDRVVQEFAHCCRRSVREIDLIGRYGGEEILVFLPETGADQAMLVAERIREATERMPIQISDQELHISVSIGVSERDENTPDLETLIARADQAMYVAKYKGRNQVAISR